MLVSKQFLIYKKIYRKTDLNDQVCPKNFNILPQALEQFNSCLRMSVCVGSRFLILSQKSCPHLLRVII